MTRAFVRASIFGVLFFLASAAGAAAQTRPTNPAPSADPPTPIPGAAADEDFELDITQRRITERDFQAATEVATRDEESGGLQLRVGARVRAGDIDVLLRNVRGRVRFRASLEPVLRLLDARRGRPQLPFR